MAEKSKADDEIVDDQGDEAEDFTPFKYAITSYGADYPVDSIIKRMDESNGSIYVPPFQRKFVWTLKQASRFIESLLLGLPVPGIFLSKDADTQKQLIIDGQQRLRSLQFFYLGVFAETKRQFALTGVQPKFEGKTYRTLAEDDRRRLDDSIIHATITRQEEPSDDNSSTYYLFERLNTGGTLLQAQEIRACIYHGAFDALLKELNSTPDWRELFGPVHSRLRDQELILRFFAFLYDRAMYTKPMKSFLNRFMAANRRLSKHPADELRHMFTESVQVLARSIGGGAFKPRTPFNAAVFDSIMVGIATRLMAGPISDLGAVENRYLVLLEDPDYLPSILTSTADEESVKRRMTLATTAFSDVK